MKCVLREKGKFSENGEEKKCDLMKWVLSERVKFSRVGK